MGGWTTWMAGHRAFGIEMVQPDLRTSLLVEIGHWRAGAPTHASRCHCRGCVAETYARELAGAMTKSPFIVMASKMGIVMKKLSTVLFGVVILATTISSVATPAFALGGCGPNRHRNGWGNCVWGGQNQDWCLRKTGHTATRMPNGTLHCF